MIGKQQCVKLTRALVVMSLMLGITGIAWGQAKTNDKPNILIFVADDLGWADPGFRGSPIETPVIDRLAQEGVQLNRVVAGGDQS